MRDGEAAAAAATGRTSGAGRRADDGSGRVFPCEGCGADLEFSIGQQQLECPYCGFRREIEGDSRQEVAEQDFHAMLARMAEVRKSGKASAAGGGEGETLSEVRCGACGAAVVFPGTLTSTSCSFCDTPVQLADVHTAEDRVPVDGVLPFKIDTETARGNLAAWVKSRWFAPGEFKRRGVRGAFQGVYLPFWTFDSHTHTRYSGERGEHYYVTVGSGDNERRERRTRWYSASGSFERFFDDVLVIAAAGLPAKLVEELEPWPLAEVVPFDQRYLAGYFAQTYDVDLHAGFLAGKQRIDEELRDEVRMRIGGDEQRVRRVNTAYDPITYKHLLLPAWILAYRYGGKSYRVLVNAGTGEVQGERPWSWWKIGAAVLTVAGVAAVAWFYLGPCGGNVECFR